MMRFFPLLFVFSIFGSLSLEAETEMGRCAKRDRTACNLVTTIGAAYTYLYANQSGLAIYADLNPSNVSGLRSESASTVYYPTVNPQSGFDIFGSVGCKQSGVEISFMYNWFANENNPFDEQVLIADDDTAGALMPDPNLHPEWPVFPPIMGKDAFFVFDAIANLYPGKVSGVWNNRFNRIDLTLSKFCCRGVSFDLKPFFGLVLAQEDQEFKSSYSVSSLTTTTPATPASATTWIITQDWFGIGPSVGFSSAYHLWQSEGMDNNWSLCAKGGGVLACSRVLAESRFYWINTTDDTAGDKPTEVRIAQPISSYSERVVSVSPAFDACLSICGDWLVGDTLVKMTLGWKNSIWLSHGYIDSLYTHSTGKGAYYMQGLSLSFSVGY